MQAALSVDSRDNGPQHKDKAQEYRDLLAKLSGKPRAQKPQTSAALKRDGYLSP